MLVILLIKSGIASYIDMGMDIYRSEQKNDRKENKFIGPKTQHNITLIVVYHDLRLRVVSIFVPNLTNPLPIKLNVLTWHLYWYHQSTLPTFMAIGTTV